MMLPEEDQLTDLYAGMVTLYSTDKSLLQKVFLKWSGLSGYFKLHTFLEPHILEVRVILTFTTELCILNSCPFF